MLCHGDDSYTTSTSYLKRLENAAKGISSNDSDWNVATLRATLKVRHLL